MFDRMNDEKFRKMVEERVNREMRGFMGLTVHDTDFTVTFAVNFFAGYEITAMQNILRDIDYHVDMVGVDENECMYFHCDENPAREYIGRCLEKNCRYYLEVSDDSEGTEDYNGSGKLYIEDENLAHKKEHPEHRVVMYEVNPI